MRRFGYERERNVFDECCMTAALGFYGTVGALYAELIKHNYERNGLHLAVLVIFCLIMLMGTIWLFMAAHSKITHSEFGDR